MKCHDAIAAGIAHLVQNRGRSLRGYTSLDEIVCVPLTTHQQRRKGIRYIERMHVFFQKSADVYHRQIVLPTRLPLS